MINLKSFRIQDIALSSHAIQRAKERIDLGLDKNSLEFEFKLKELIRNSRPMDVNGKVITSYFVYNGERFKVIILVLNSKKILVKTLMGE